MRLTQQRKRIFLEKTEIYIKFKQKYHFTPISSDNMLGTITLDGKAYIVDLKTKSLTMMNGDKEVPRATSSRHLDGLDIIILDGLYFKLKNQGRRNAMLHHEIGHSTREDPDNKNSGADITKKVQELDKKYGIKGSHARGEEFFADRYAADRTSEKDMKRSLREIYKRANSPKDFKTVEKAYKRIAKNQGYRMNRVNRNSPEGKRIIKEDNKEFSTDYKARSKALKSSDSRNIDTDASIKKEIARYEMKIKPLKKKEDIINEKLRHINSASAGLSGAKLESNRKKYERQEDELFDIMDERFALEKTISELKDKMKKQYRRNERK